MLAGVIGFFVMIVTLHPLLRVYYVSKDVSTAIAFAIGFAVPYALVRLYYGN